MIIKPVDDKSPLVAQLEGLLCEANEQQRKAVKRELAILRAGIKGEQESAYHLDFHFRDSQNNMLIHDLRIEHNGRVAQIDHLLINRCMDFFVLETKHFGTGLKVDDNGQFLRWNPWEKSYEGMASPVEQANRQGLVLKGLVSSLDWPTRAGLTIVPSIAIRVLVSPAARLILSKHQKQLTQTVVKADEFFTHYKSQIEKEGVLSTLASMAKVVSQETVQAAARMLADCHRPLVPDYRAKFGLPERPQAPASQAPAFEAKCRFCQSSFVEMVHGRYGYYFKCSACGKNTPPPFGCQKGKTCTSRIRKERARLTQYCHACGWERHLHTNPESTGI